MPRAAGGSSRSPVQPVPTRWEQACAQVRSAASAAGAPRLGRPVAVDLSAHEFLESVPGSVSARTIRDWPVPRASATVEISATRQSLGLVTAALRCVRESPDDRHSVAPRPQLPEVINPSITGISTSSRIRSGRNVSMAVNADCPSAAVPATSRLPSAQTTERRRLRITVESSTIKIRVRWPGAHRSGLHQAKHGRFSLSASSSKGFIRYSSAPASNARRMKRSPPRSSPSSL